MKDADEAIVYYDPEVIKRKGMAELSTEDIESAFGGSITVFDGRKKFEAHIKSKDLNDSVLLLMSSGNFGGIVLEDLAKDLLKN